MGGERNSTPLGGMSVQTQVDDGFAVKLLGQNVFPFSECSYSAQFTRRADFSNNAHLCPLLSVIFYFVLFSMDALCRIKVIRLHNLTDLFLHLFLTMTCMIQRGCFLLIL